MRRSLSTLIRQAQHRGLDRDDNFPHLVTGGEPRIAGRNGVFDDALASFAMAYAGQTIKDHAALAKAKGGGVPLPAPAEKRERKSAAKREAP